MGGCYFSLINKAAIVVGVLGLLALPSCKHFNVKTKYISKTGNSIESKKEQFEYAKWAAENGFCFAGKTELSNAVEGFSLEGLEKLGVGAKDFYDLDVALGDCYVNEAKRTYLFRNEQGALTGFDYMEMSQNCNFAETHLKGAIALEKRLEGEDAGSIEKINLIRIIQDFNFYCGDRGLLERSRNGSFI
ncbi:hypothetical protein HOK51_01010 [Candidatus Woesearchaeota archaeon]|jgi:hypothetical protein|nr:hypothetical protein [Candidatus Woesearchaeota archaeon]MBT6518395.1 hypothetical protein [Candidatus Woesearchaeota archaeon]MBT7366825.1 hypothetical protein [Candidatus Woesearchaeota archaeon]